MNNKTSIVIITTNFGGGRKMKKEYFIGALVGMGLTIVGEKVLSKYKDKLAEKAKCLTDLINKKSKSSSTEEDPENVEEKK